MAFAADLAGVAPSPSTMSSVAASTVADADRYAPDPNSTLSYLTPDDRRMIEVSTGLKINSGGVVQNPRPEGIDNFTFNVAADRMYGKLQGPVTAGYLNDLAARYANAQGQDALDSAALDRALAYLQTNGQRIDAMA